jgi:formylmethanofuran dehydrogenase subunit C
MVEYVLHMKYVPNVPVEARDVKPDIFAGRGINEIKDIEVYEGNSIIKLSDLFDVQGPEMAPKEPNEIRIVIKGDGTSRIRMLGFKMNGGEIVVEGDIGYLAGYKMRGGTVRIKGNARGWLGAKMKDGIIEVDGDAGDFVGGKFMGEKPGKGMRGGKIIIHGNAGSNVGAGMKKGAIIIEGDVGKLVGAYMTGGTIIVQGSCGAFAGARMTGGKILLAGRVDGVLPSFYVDSLLPKAKAKAINFAKPFMLLSCDIILIGTGMVYISYNENAEVLSRYRDLIEEVVLD